jgi:alpha-tubulin suppressor-like RCC1 family protein
VLLFISFFSMKVYSQSNKILAFSWGSNIVGELGLGNLFDKVNYNVPHRINIDQSWKVLGSGKAHVLAVKSNGSLWAWGWNEFGQLGISNYENQSKPTQIGIDTNWQQIGQLSYHSIAIKKDGTLWAWGWNSSGQLGLGNTVTYNTPQQIGTDSNWSYATCASTFSVAIKKDGTLWAWGDNRYGNLGLGNKNNYNTPQQIGTDTNWINISVSDRHVLALKKNGTIWSWGQYDTTIPKQIGSDNDWSIIAAGAISENKAIKKNGTLWTWGRGYHGIENIPHDTFISQPVQLDSKVYWKNVSIGGGHTLALTRNGSLWSWGHGANGQLGLGDTLDYNIPKQIGVDTSWISLHPGWVFSIALAAPDLNLNLKDLSGSEGKIIFYPNPTSDKLFIEFDQNSKQGYELEILDVTGKSVYKGKIKSQKETIDVSKWNSKGIYLVRILDKNKNQIENRKIVIE